jgi:hypothetical protein
VVVLLCLSIFLKKQTPTFARSSTPFSTRWFLIPILPFTIPVMFAMWAQAKPFVHTFYVLRGRLHYTWVIPRFGFQYLLPFAQEGINNLIEDAILSAEKLGDKVISLTALNKNKALNGGGTLFVRKHPNLRVWVVHGNILTAAVIINEIRPDVKEVFLTGATSKFGRAIAFYPCRKQVRVLMLTSFKRFRRRLWFNVKSSLFMLISIKLVKTARHG